MGSGSISYFINGFHCSVYCGIKPMVYSVQAISRSMVPGTPTVLIQELPVSALLQRSVSADNYQSVDAVFLQTSAARFWPSSVRISAQRAVYKDGTSALDGVGYIAGCHVDDFFVHQSVVAFQDTFI